MGKKDKVPSGLEGQWPVSQELPSLHGLALGPLKRHCCPGLASSSETHRFLCLKDDPFCSNIPEVVSGCSPQEGATACGFVWKLKSCSHLNIWI